MSVLSTKYGGFNSNYLLKRSCPLHVPLTDTIGIQLFLGDINILTKN